MLFAKQVKFLADKTEAEATSATIKIKLGVIWRVWVTFPPGCAGLTKLRLYIDEHPFLPVEKDAYIRGDGITYEVPVSFEIKQKPAIVRVEGWNEDDTYDHTIDVYILVVDKEWIMPVGSTEGILAGLKSLVLRPIIIKPEAEAKT